MAEVASEVKGGQAVEVCMGQSCDECRASQKGDMQCSQSQEMRSLPSGGVIPGRSGQSQSVSAFGIWMGWDSLVECLEGFGPMRALDHGLALVQFLLGVSKSQHLGQYDYCSGKVQGLISQVMCDFWVSMKVLMSDWSW
jgi:hypothetical protein